MESSPVHTGTDARRSPWRMIIGSVLIICSLAYIYYALRGELRAMLTELRSISPARTALAVLCATGMYYTKAIYHRTLLARITGRNQSLASVPPAYAQAQIVRYLPGKVWGLLHQANQLGRYFSPQEVMVANLLQTVATYLMSLGVIGSALAASATGSPWPLLGIPATLAAMELLHRRPMLERLVVSTIASLGRGRFGTAALAAIPVAPIRWHGTALLALEWVAFYLMWLLISNSGIPSVTTLTLATWYAAASILAIFALVVPAGLAVREAIFVSIAGLGNFPQSTLLAVAAVTRLVMSLGELCCIPLSTLVKFIEQHPRNSGR